MVTSPLRQLEDSIIDTLYDISAHDLPAACVSLGLTPGEGSEAFSSKKKYVRVRLAGKSLSDLTELGKRTIERYPNYQLQEVLCKLSPPSRPISDITRRKLIESLSHEKNLTGALRIEEFFGQLWPLDKLIAPNLMQRTVLDCIFQHMVRNDDWTIAQLLDSLDVMHVSQQQLFKFLELLVHPTIRQNDDQERLVAIMNELLKQDGLQFAPSDVMSGYQVFAIVPMAVGVQGQAKNLIFAADGPKPEIVLSDAINNDIKIVKYAENCLVYNRQLPRGGLRWQDLVAWWTDMNPATASGADPERDLYRRLAKSLGSEPERLLFRTYFEHFRPILGESLPALIPQVYLHYDPYTARQLGYQRLLRQRMDFLLLLAQGQRLVIEVDGKQHYSDEFGPSPKRYAEMVSADRELRLGGYEVYRFGGLELIGDPAKATIVGFFQQLFAKHAIGPTSSASARR